MNQWPTQQRATDASRTAADCWRSLTVGRPVSRLAFPLEATEEITDLAGPKPNLALPSLTQPNLT